MNYNTKGVRFHPTDAEAMEILWDKINLDRDSIVQIGDSLVQVITQLKDICKFEPEELPGRSELKSGDNISYFFCSPRYKYRNSNRKNRVTKNGYWKPTGKPREIVTIYNGKEITGTRQTLVFYKGRVSNKNKIGNKTPWIMHEFELTNQKNLTLCKLKQKYGKVDASRGEGKPSNLENHCTSNAIPKEQLNSSEPLIEPEAFTEYSGIQSEFTTTNDDNDDDDDDDDDEFVDSLLINNDEFYSNHLNFVDEDESPKLSSTFQIHAADYDIPKNREDFRELINQKPKSPNDCVGTRNEGRTSENENSSWSLILIANDQTYSKEGSSLLAGNEGSGLALENEVAVDSIPQEYPEFDECLRNGIFMDELLPVMEAPKNPDDGVQNHNFNTIGFWNSIFFTTDEIEAYTQDLGCKQQNLSGKNEDFNFTTRKRPRIESERLTSEANIEASPSPGKDKFS